jgi:hypothetical protein
MVPPPGGIVGPTGGIAPSAWTPFNGGLTWLGPNDNNEMCVIGLLDLFSGMLWVGDYMASAATECGLHVIPQAGCVAESLAIGANMLEIGRFAIDINRTCIPRFAQVFDEQTAGVGSTQNIGACLMDVDIESASLERTSMEIMALFQECQLKDPRACFVDIFNLIGNFAWAAQFLTASILDCSPEVVFDLAGAVCSEAISNTIAEVTSLVAELAVIEGCRLAEDHEEGADAGEAPLPGPEVLPPQVPGGPDIDAGEASLPPGLGGSKPSGSRGQNLGGPPSLGHIFGLTMR